MPSDRTRLLWHRGNSEPISLDDRIDGAEEITADPMVVSIAALSDPAADRIMFWDDSGSLITWLTAGTGLSITGTTLACTVTGISDGDKGDITVSASGVTWTIDNDAVTYAKIQNVSATDKLLGRSTAGAGDVEEITCTAAGRALLDDADAAAQRTTLTAAARAQTAEQISGFIASPSDKSYTLALKMAHAGTITETTTKSASGTCTATFKVNSTALGGTANSVSSAEQSQAHSGTNTFVAGDDIVLTVSSNSSCADMSFSIKYTRTLE